jgi:hypothetical protein
MRCAKCGHETPDASKGQAAVRVLGDAGWREIVPALYCAHCAAPVRRQRSVRAEPPGGTGDVTTWPQPADQRTGVRMPPRRGLVIAGVLLAGLVAAFVGVGLGHSSSGQQLAVDQLRPRDCLTGSNLGLGTSNPWPDLVTAVPCTQMHLAEVFFAGNAWPQSLAYPGENAIANQAANRCTIAFEAYDGISPNLSAFTFDTVDPSGSDDWASGDRWLVCVAYYGTAPVNYSIKGAYQ